MRALKALLCCGALIISQAFAKPMPLDKIAAVVNDSIITQSELAQQVRLIEQQLNHEGRPAPEKALLEKQVLEHLILNEIQLQMAKKTGIQIDDTTLDNEIENIAKQNHLDLTQMREALAKEGIEYNHYRNNMRQQMIISQLQRRDLLPDLQVSEQEVTQFLQSPNGLGGMITEYRIGHLLVALPEAPSPEELAQGSQKALKIISELRAGKDFAQMAMEQASGDAALNGGDLGWRKLPEIPTIFVKVIPTLKVNDVPEPIRSPSGFHIIKLMDKRSAAQVQSSIGKTLVRHILIKTNAITSDNDAKQKLTQLRDKILAGEEFSQLAKTYSADLGSASNGGSLGWVSKDVLVPEFASTMENTNIQEISEPFKTAFGWHILQVMERKTQTNDEAELRQKAKGMIQQRKYEEKLQTWTRQLRDEAFVKTEFAG